MENKYYEWIFLVGDKHGITHILHDKIKDEWFLVHATGYKFPFKLEDGILKGYTYFYT